MKAEGKGKKGFVKENHMCPKCHGDGRIRGRIDCEKCLASGFVMVKCGLCGGKGKTRQNDRGKVDYGLSTVRCNDCRGRGRFRENCPKCNGNKKVDKYTKCMNCGGNGEVSLFAGIRE